MTTNILVHEVEPPQELVRIIYEDCKDEDTVSEVIICKDQVQDGSGLFNPQTKTIVLDLNAIAKMSNEFRNEGMLYLPSVWYMTLFTWWHELNHADQLESTPSLSRYHTLPDVYERNAHLYAFERLVELTSEGHKIPKLETMGWLGENINYVINRLYHKHPELAEEIDVAYAGGVTDAKFAPKISEFTKEQHNELIQMIDNGDTSIGIKMNGRHYLNGVSVFTWYYDEHQYRNAALTAGR